MFSRTRRAFSLDGQRLLLDLRSPSWPGSVKYRAYGFSCFSCCILVFYSQNYILKKYRKMPAMSASIKTPKLSKMPSRENNEIAVLRIRDVYPGFRILIFYPSQIQKPQQKRGVKKICCHTFFVATNCTKLKIILFLKCRRKQFGSFQRIIEHFTQKFVTKL
jgi:hypothetical protein